MNENRERSAAIDALNYRVALKGEMRRHLITTMGSDPASLSSYRCYKSLAYAVRSRLINNWIQSQRAYYTQDVKRVYYLSMEFLLGRMLVNCLINLGFLDPCRVALMELGYRIEEVEAEEVDAGLGNGGLGRLAACFLDSMASLGIPAYGYGILYDYGMFFQRIVDGYQVENTDNWLRYGCPWLIERPESLALVRFGGRVNTFQNPHGQPRHEWVDTENVMAMPCDILIPGYGHNYTINLRLWAARSSRELNLAYFQQGNYIEAVEEKIRSESISRVLYPSEEVRQGRELRLKQEYFFVAATFRDIMRRHKKRFQTFEMFPQQVAVQLNDTHPAIAIPEFMRLLVDEEGVPWEAAWDICRRTFGYTNHTIMPEALETWSVDLLGRLLPRHLQIIYDINHHFLQGVAELYPGNVDKLRNLSIIEEGPSQRVRMAHLAVVGSHSVNGVSEVHSNIIQERLFKDFYEMFPERFNNKTNGVTPRRWLVQANPPLAAVITEKIGPAWLTDLMRLEELVPLAEDADFRDRCQYIKLRTKERLAAYLGSLLQTQVHVNTLFDVQVKRIHEYKRQLLNLFHVISRYNHLKDHPEADVVPRTVIFGGKAAPGYWMARLIIKLINSVAELINADPDLEGRLQVLFVPNYCVSVAEKIIPATELSEQISTAGTEASGTGNMKFALNGALTIGTLDGANIEIREAVGADNIFIFGLRAEEVAELHERGYDPWNYYHADPELRRILDQIAGGFFSPGQPDLFKPVVDSLLFGGDRFLLLADFRAYLECQRQVETLYRNQDEWTRRGILNVAHMGRFSSDHTIRQYAREIWEVPSLLDTAPAVNEEDAFRPQMGLGS